MTIPVPLDELRAALAERGEGAYLLTVSDDARPHAVHVPVAWRGEALAVEVGTRSAANAAARPLVSLLFPVRQAGDYSLIVDGRAAADGQRLLIAPLKAVLHRPAAGVKAAAAADAACGADCVPLLPGERERS
jgi:hypothetical protein